MRCTARLATGFSPPPAVANGQAPSIEQRLLDPAAATYKRTAVPAVVPPAVRLMINKTISRELLVVVCGGLTVA